MIFLSHQHNDKEFVGDIAHTLKAVFGEDKVFYDSWSIKPGDNIIGEMENGLKDCKYFFFFITENSLNSEMVKLEWTTALMRRADRQIKFIPIRAENVEVPMIISTLRYLDLYNEGLEVVKTQIIEIISGEETEQKFPIFKNLQAYVIQNSETELHYYVTAKRFFEPNSKFMLVTTLNRSEASFGLLQGGMSMNNYNPEIGMIGDLPLNGFYLSIESGVHKGFKVGLKFSTKEKTKTYIQLYHVKTEASLEPIETIAIESITQLPNL